MSVTRHGVNRRELDRRLIELGGTVVFLKRTGEVQYLHPALPERPRANGRRKDAPRHLTQFVMRLERIVGKNAANEDNA